MTTSLQISCKTPEELPMVASGIVEFANERKLEVWLFEGEMGAGKTTLIKAVCKQLGVGDTVQSPTFSIVNEYWAAEGNPVYHFDFYRINELEEAVQIGAEEYFYSGNLCLIEWPSKVEALLPDRFLKVEIEVEKDSSRKILLSVYE